MKRGATMAWTLLLAATGVLSAGVAWAAAPTEVPIPEPTSLALIAVGVGAIAIFRARRGR